MPDSRNIVRTSGVGPGVGQDPSAGAQPVAILPAAYGRTARFNVDTGGSALPMALLGENPNRRSAVVYNPATNPTDSAAGALVWIGFDPNQPQTFFPLEAGAQFVHESRDWLYAWTEAAAGSAVYVAEELY